jgi:death-on-curing protein
VKSPIWLEREDCLAIHEMMLSQHGGLAGVRDEGMLASALARLQNRLAYQSSSSLPVLAASS